MRYHRFTRLLQDGNGDFTGNTGKVAQELIQSDVPPEFQAKVSEALPGILTTGGAHA